MSAVVKVRMRGSRYAYSGGWVRVVHGTQVPADYIYWYFKSCSPIEELARVWSLPEELVEDVIRWYLNNWQDRSCVELRWSRS